MIVFRLDFPANLDHPLGWFGTVDNAGKFARSVTLLFFDDAAGFGLFTCADDAWPAYQQAMQPAWQDEQSVSAISQVEAGRLFEESLQRRLG